MVREWESPTWNPDSTPHCIHLNNNLNSSKKEIPLFWYQCHTKDISGYAQPNKVEV